MNEKEAVLPSVGINVNGTVLEDLGLTGENQKFYIGGAVVLVVVFISLFVILRRRSK